jgi:hypothetical protein
MTASGMKRPLRNKSTDKRLVSNKVKTTKSFKKNGDRYTISSYQAGDSTGIDFRVNGRSVDAGARNYRKSANNAGTISNRQSKFISNYTKNYFKKNSK